MKERKAHSPRSLDDVAALVAWAVAEEQALEIVGNGSKRELGHPVDTRHVLDLTGLHGITMYEPEELVMTAQAGTPLAEIEAALAEREQELAFEPADYGAILGGALGRQTIGGVFACNLAGPRRVRAGAARDHLLGLRCVTGQGVAIKTGGRVVKNVTGYDLCKLLAGSYGTLAVMTELTFKVLPRAETEATLLVSGAGESELLATLRRALGTVHDVSGAACLTPLCAGRSAVPSVNSVGRSLAALRLEGPTPSVAYRVGRLQAELSAPGLDFVRLAADDSRTLWREIRDLKLVARNRPLWRLSLPPSASSELSDWATRIARERLWDWGGGLLWLAPQTDWADAAETVRSAFDGRGGHAMLVRADEELRRRIAVFNPQPPPLAALTRRVKNGFDPKRILNPGRMYADV